MRVIAILAGLTLAIFAHPLIGQVFTPPSAPKPRAKPAPRPAPSPQPAPVKPARKPSARPPAPVETQERASVPRTLPLSAIGGMDSYIRSSLPTALWSKEKAIIVGGWGDEYRGLIWFDVNRLPEIPEDYSVYLYLYERAPDDGTANRPTSMISYRAASSISSQTTWQNRPEVERDTEWEREVNGDGWLALDITSYVESWRAGAPNYGIVFVPRSTNNKFNVFVASDDTTRPSLHPYIRIERVGSTADKAGDLPQGFSEIEVSSCPNLPPVRREGRTFECRHQTVRHEGDGVVYFVYSSPATSNGAPRRWLIAADYHRPHGIELVGIISARDDVRIVHGREHQPLVLAVDLRDTENPLSFYEVMFKPSGKGQSDWRLVPLSVVRTFGATRGAN